MARYSIYLQVEDERVRNAGDLPNISVSLTETDDPEQAEALFRQSVVALRGTGLFPDAEIVDHWVDQPTDD